MVKACFKCGETKPLAEYYRHPRMADGHLNKCKACAKQDVWESRHVKHRDRVLSYERQRAAEPHRVELRARTTTEWAEQHPERRRAQALLARAVRDGRVWKWPACAVPDCTSTEPVAHHPDYSRPLDVVWLCQAHHKQAHALVTGS